MSSLVHDQKLMHTFLIPEDENEQTETELSQEL